MSQQLVPVPIPIGTFQGQPVLECELRSPSTGVLIKVLSYGALIRDWQVPLADGSRRSVVLGFDQFEQYPERSPFFGAIVGRVANRIGGSRFTLDGKQFLLPANEGSNHLHGGSATFGKRLWQMRQLSATSVQLQLLSADGDGGYPGNLSASVLYRLDDHRLTIEMEARTDAPTPVNLVQHNYFNLAAGGGDVRQHWLQMDAPSFTPLDAGKVPTGAILPVDGTSLDFRTGKPLAEADTGQLDHNFVLTPADQRNWREKPAATLQAPDQSMRLRLWTDQPAMQVYTGGGLGALEDVPGLNGQQHGRYGAVCLEDQNFPDAVNKAAFPSPIIRPGQPYRHWCQIEIAPVAVAGAGQDCS